MNRRAQRVRLLFAKATAHLLAAGAGRQDEAARSIAAAIRVDPTRAAYHTHLGQALDALRRPDDAIAAYERAVLLQPDDARTHAALGTVLHGLGRLDQAVGSYRMAIRLAPDLVDARCNLGGVLRLQGRTLEATAAYGDALRIDPANTAAHDNLGNALGDAGRHAEAAAAYASALRRHPDDPQARVNFGNALAELGRLDEALEAYDAVLQRRPEFAAAHFNRGNVLKEYGRLDEAILAYEAAIRLRPDHAEAHSNLIVSAHHVDGQVPATILAKARQHARTLEAARPLPAFANVADPDRRLRIGYVSGDLGQHPVGFFLAPVLACHDRTAIEVVCYSNRDRSDALADRLRGSSDQWRRLVGLSDDAVASLVRADRIDILVDLAGHTARNRLGLFAAKPAPVQATWAGCWGTIGLSRMDYILSDAVTIPPGEEAGYSEQVLRLPGCRFCYAPPDNAPDPAPPPCLRRGPVTFGSFNNLSKLGPRVVRLWARILHAVPQSRLLLKWRSLDGEAVRCRIGAGFADRGIDPRRLELRGASPHAAMLDDYGEVDIALDPSRSAAG